MRSGPRASRLLEVTPRSQRSAANWSGKLPDYVQCYYTSACVFLSHWIDDAASDAFYAEYVDDVEQLVGKPGIGETVMAKMGLKKTDRSGAYAAVHLAAMQARLGYKANLKFDMNIPFEQMPKIIDGNSPIVLNSMFTHAGHVVTVVGRTPSGFWVVDSWGDKRDGYKTTTPGPHEYGNDLMKSEGRAADGKFWGIYAI